MKTNTLVSIVIALQVVLIIIGISCLRQMNTDDTNQPTQTMSGMHMMPDGTMMSNMGSSDDMSSMMMDMTARMEGKTGDELDKVFLEDMIIHHEGAVDMAKELQKGTKRPELQKMAKDIIDVQTKEISMMQQWLTDWFGATN